MPDDNPLGYGGDTGIGGSDSGFFDWKSNPQGPGADKPQEESGQSREIDSSRDLYNNIKKLHDEKYEKWDSMETALNAMRNRFFQTLQEDKNIKPPVPMAHPAPPDMSPEDAQALQKAGMGAIATTMPMNFIGGLRNRNSGFGALMGGIGSWINSVRASHGKGPLGGGLTRHQKFVEAYTQWRAADKLVSEYNKDQVDSYKEILANKKMEQSDQLEAIKTLAAIYKDPIIEADAKAKDAEKLFKHIDDIQKMEERRKRGVSDLDAQAFKMMSGDQKFKDYAAMVYQKSRGKIDLMDEAHFKEHFLQAAKDYPYQEFEGEVNPNKETGKSKHPEMAPDSQKPKITADDLNNILGD